MDISNIKFGTGEFQFGPILELMKRHLDEPSLAKLADEWVAFCFNMGLSRQEVTVLGSRIRARSVKPEDILLEIFTVWNRDNHKEHANLQVLCMALRVMGFEELAELIKEKFSSQFKLQDNPESMDVDTAQIAEDPPKMPPVVAMQQDDLDDQDLRRFGQLGANFDLF